jgi:seryl-tRNA synthetase
MLDLSYILQNAEAVKNNMINKGEKDTAVVDQLIDAQTNWLSLIKETEAFRQESNSRAKQIGQLMGQGKKEEAQEIIKQSALDKKKIKDLEEQLQQVQAKRDDLQLRVPNIAHESVPIGSTESDNVTFSTWGNIQQKDWYKPHWELLEQHGWVDFNRGSKVAGAGFPFYVDGIAKLQRALIQFFLDEATEKGYTEIQPPYFVNEDSARGTGQIPDKEDMMYTVDRDGFFNIPTAEVPVTNFHRDEIFNQEQLPIKYAAYTPCWRREAGSYGADVRGLNRLHQFDKVELVKFVHPDKSYEELEQLRADAEALLQKLELPYRTLLMCTGDMGFTQSKKYDLEVWSVGQKRWLEVSSCSNFESFQARRMKIRFKNDQASNNQMVHTLNGSGLAIPRVVAAIVEQYQTEDGNVRVPEVLKPYIKRDIL